MSADILPFPPQGKKCKTCGFVMVPTDDDPVDRDECHCCLNGIPLPLQWDNPCPDCKGKGKVVVPIVRDDRSYSVIGAKVESCVACLGKGHRE